MRNRVYWIMAVVFLAIFYLAGSLGARVYRYQDLSLQGLTFSGEKSISAINDAAWIVGYSYDISAHTNQPFVWRPRLGLTNLQNPSYPMEAYAHGINNQGQIVGQANNISWPNVDAAYWASPTASPRYMTTLTIIYNTNCAYGINETGQVAGEGTFGEPRTAEPIHAARWPRNFHSDATDLGTLGGTTSTGRSINNAGLVAGSADTDADPSTRQACLWIPGQQPQQIPLPGNPLSSGAYVITNHGTVLGSAFLGMGGGQAFFYDNRTGEAQYIVPGAYSSSASGMSDADEVVGWYKILQPFYFSMLYYWTPGGGRKNLNNLVVNLPPGVTLSSVAAISRSGRYITGIDSQGHVYLLSASASVPISLLLSD
jgi:uncharacterized membrane protein